MHRLDPLLGTVPGTASVWLGPVGGPPAYQRAAEAPHYAASLMKIPILAALYRAGRPLTTRVVVHNDFASAAPGRPRFSLERRHDPDDAVWHHLGGTAPVGWLAERMIVWSSNLAANLLLEDVGTAAVSAVWAEAGVGTGVGVSVVGRGIGDTAAEAAEVTNRVTARDLAALLASLRPDELATLAAQRRGEELLAGLPPGVPVAHKNGWVMGVRHSAAIVSPPDAPPFVLVVCLSTPLAVNRTDDDACQIVSEVARIAYANRHDLG